ncbi:Callose synthase 9 [Acorus calamus]|uniref:Callose synthase 9 n=1 Tax=Acorus calamus TaxID=4465 RepID=A0AAV9D538_ACOCL|nr:Callose synthase 9 [Acorus calamus]
MPLGEGKPENQNHAIIFSKGECLQTIDMNHVSRQNSAPDLLDNQQRNASLLAQDNYLEEASKMCNILQEFTRDHGIPPPTILDVREHIFTGKIEQGPFSLWSSTCVIASLTSTENDHSLEMTMLEQQKVDDNISKLDEEHKKKMEEMDEHMKEQMEDMEDLQSLIQTLVIKERLINDELQEARKVIIEGLKEILNTGTLIGIERMGELDEKPFQMARKRKYAIEEANVIAAELCSVWQQELQKPNWHPFKIVAVDGQTQRPNIHSSMKTHEKEAKKQ